MKRLDLLGSWMLQEVGQSATLPATMPGDVHSTLLAAGKIPDPYFGTNELQIQWVGQKEWILRREFTVEEALLAETSIFLNADVLDTITEIRLNGQLAGTTDNIYRRWRFEVKPLLKVGVNTIEILFRCANAVAAERAAKQGYPVPHGGGSPLVKHINQLRKVPCHGGWDWGITLMALGIYGDLYLGATSLARLEYVYCTQQHQPGQCTVEVTTEVTAVAAGRAPLRVTLGEQVVEREVDLVPGLNVLTATLTVPQPRLWWPHGYGEQPLYDLVVEVAGERHAKKLGLRHLEVVNQPDAVGISMIFRVNGKDIFCKGANWIPCDALPARQTVAKYEALLDAALAANMNMLRIWGGGQYECDAMYQLCDAKGILIWQDFMFSCALYPADEPFLENVRQEIRHQLKRLRDYACIGLWCGDNECLGSLGWFEESRKNRDFYVTNYDRLNHGVLAKTVAECDPTRTFWPSSPCAGPGNFADNWHDDRKGDMHFWAVWHENKDFETYYKVRPRFCSEFGYQAFPNLATIRTYATPKDFNLTAPVMEHHQKNNNGNTLINGMFARYFRIPNGFENFVYLSQVQQAVAIKLGVEYWRTLRPHCMGTLYWQLNDNWPVASWASVGYDGRWKLLHHFARRFYAPLLFTARHQGDAWEFWLVNDGPAVPNAAWKVEVRDLHSARVIKTLEGKLNLPAEGAQQVSVNTTTAELTERPTETFLELTLTTAAGSSSNTFFFVPYKQCYLPEATISAKLLDGGKGVTLSTDHPAFFVTLEQDTPHGEYSDNGITLLPKQPVTLRWQPAPGEKSRFLKLLPTVRHLRSSY